MGRFISEDPVGFYGGGNFFAYVGGNPVGYTDPYGHFVFTAAAVGLALYYAGLATAGVLTAVIAGTALAEATGAMDQPEPVPVPPPVPVPVPVPVPNPTTDSTTTTTTTTTTTAKPKKDCNPTCLKLYELCDQTRWNYNPDYGTHKPCDDCLAQCNRTGGEWDFVKCPIFE